MMKRIYFLVIVLIGFSSFSLGQTENESVAPALLIVDIQEFYFPGDGPGLVGAEEASLKAKEVLQIFRKKNLPVIHVRHQSSKGFGFHPNVRPQEGELIITKNEVNCFSGTDLRDQLMDMDVDRLIIIGMQTHMCLEAAVRAAHDFGYDCIVVEDACATRDLIYGDKSLEARDVHASTLATITGGGYGRVINLERLNENLNKYLFE